MDLMIGDTELGELVASWIEAAAIVVITVTVVMALVRAGVAALARGPQAFDRFKQVMARGLLVGLDLLIAADIIASVTIDPQLEELVGLTLIVIIRIFLSWSLIVEAQGRWPWQARNEEPAEGP